MQKIFKLLTTGIFTVCVILSGIFASGAGTANAVHLDEGKSVYADYNILKVSENALFKKDGTLDLQVAKQLIYNINEVIPRQKQNGVSKWYSGETYTGPNYAETTAADYSDYVARKLGNSQSGALLIKLFESYGTDMGNVDNFTSMWWQAVYRSTGDGADVLTLYMVEPYRNSYFNDSTNVDGRNKFYDDYSLEANPNLVQGVLRNNSETDYKNEGNYSQSIARTNLKKDFSEVLGIYTAAETVIAAPNSLPGLWQSSDFQTGTGRENSFFQGSMNMGVGASATDFSTNSYAINNGLDGQGLGQSGQVGTWPITSVSSAYDDLIWLPSSFEMQCLGRDKDIISPLGTLNSKDTISNSNRHGLWQLNGFDRIFDKNLETSSEYIWLRSGVESAAEGVRRVRDTGTVGYSTVIYNYGLRPAIHISLSELPVETSNVSVGFKEDASEDAHIETPSEWCRAYSANVVSDYDSPNTISLDAGGRSMLSTVSINETALIISDEPAETTVIDNVCEYKAWYSDSSKRFVNLQLMRVKIPVTIEADTAYVYTVSVTDGIASVAHAVPAGTQVSLTYTGVLEDGMELKGWQLNSHSNASIDGNILTVGTGDVSVIAVLGRVQLTVTWNIDGRIVSDVIDYNEIPAFPEANPTKQDSNGQSYVFLGWATTKGANEAQFGPSDLLPITKNTAYYAVFKVEKPTGSSYTPWIWAGIVPAILLAAAAITFFALRKRKRA